MALVGSTWPAPIPFKSAGPGIGPLSVISPPLLSKILAVVMMADLIAAGDQLGWAFLINAATPLRCGVAMDVPDMKSNNNGFLVVASRNEDGTAPSMLEPGPMMSGFNIPGNEMLGPLEENEASEGEYGLFMTVPLKLNLAAAFFEELM
jgi:hypothetical protein